ncbi:hypothetical protein QEV69_01150 [Trueperella pyogenes]|uniref:hypothetical protein n=1 Tax=Trueperella pyogenes TaxID=1661 RepID=UPI00216A73C9|nr:hypothetical protein [Trueperella pyogenes]MDF2420214.1 hypothetical protein [Trueperella pyogenes]UVJ54095.1 hypothetical protein K5713_01955 [Trueperella pyogenes]
MEINEVSNRHFINVCELVRGVADHRHIACNKLRSIRNSAYIFRLTDLRKRNLFGRRHDPFNSRRSNCFRSGEKTRKIFEFGNALGRGKSPHPALDYGEVAAEIRVDVEL